MSPIVGSAACCARAESGHAAGRAAEQLDELRGLFLQNTLTDHLVGAGEQRHRNVEAERFRSTNVDDKFEHVGRLHLQPDP